MSCMPLLKWYELERFDFFFFFQWIFELVSMLIFLARKRDYYFVTGVSGFDSFLLTFQG